MGSFHLASVSRQALRPTQPPIQWILGGPFSRVKCGQGVTLTTHRPLSAEVKNEELYLALAWQ
jgi:hypothetical protein